MPVHFTYSIIMAAKRIAQSAINWSAMAEKVSESQRPMFNAFKLKSDQYLRRFVTKIMTI
jgi:F-type H+-transporting ATPase subunit d